MEPAWYISPPRHPLCDGNKFKYPHGGNVVDVAQLVKLLLVEPALHSVLMLVFFFKKNYYKI
jgi:hypothetical protein